MISRISRRLNDTDPSIIFLAVAILIGGTIRLYGVLRSNFPINDGGLFYTMIRDLMANGYRLPVTTSYNQLGLPFAYPPLMLYLAGFLADLTHWGLLNIIRVLPAVFTVLAIPAFYLLAGIHLKNKVQVLFATIIFTFIPASFDWLIMGGGLTRSPAFFFALISLYFIYRLYTENRRQDILWVTVFSSLTILSHPETALHTAASAVVFFLFFGRNKKGLLRSLLIIALILLVTAPWWATVLIHNGISPFIAA
ncbi:MAG: glycosyltransferase family 39 protein, partial [Flavisolibacter sp.]